MPHGWWNERRERPRSSTPGRAPPASNQLPRVDPAKATPGAPTRKGNNGALPEDGQMNYYPFFPHLPRPSSAMNYLSLSMSKLRRWVAALTTACCALLPAAAAGFAGSFAGAWVVTVISPGFLRKVLPFILLAVLMYTLERSVG
eukprot:gene20835-25540_t